MCGEWERKHNSQVVLFSLFLSIADHRKTRLTEGVFCWLSKSTFTMWLNVVGMSDNTCNTFKETHGSLFHTQLCMHRHTPKHFNVFELLSGHVIGLDYTQECHKSFRTTQTVCVYVQGAVQADKWLYYSLLCVGELLSVKR